MKKKLWFTDDFSPEHIAEKQSEGWLLRKASACHASDTLEVCDEVGGDVPEQYKNTEIAFDTEGFVPLEQFDAVSKKLQETEQQLTMARSEFVTFQNDVDAMKARVALLETANYNDLKIDDLKALLASKGIEFKSGALKDELITLLQG